jgi:hypothetical protein
MGYAGIVEVHHDGLSFPKGLERSKGVKQRRTQRRMECKAARVEALGVG